MTFSFLSSGSLLIGKVLGEKSYIGKYEILDCRYFANVCTVGRIMVSHPEIHSRTVFLFDDSWI